MDVNEILRLLIKALENSERNEASEHARNIANWLHRGGFMPTITADTLEYLMSELSDHVHPGY